MLNKININNDYFKMNKTQEKYLFMKIKKNYQNLKQLSLKLTKKKTKKKNKNMK